MNRERIKTYWGTVDCQWNERGIITLGVPGYTLPDPRCDLSEFGYQLEKELAAYLSGATTNLTLPFVIPNAPHFFSQVWHAVATIPYGEVRSYGEVANMVGRPNANKLVGFALINNPIAIYIPCHRVIGKDGYLGSDHDQPSLERLELKKKLLVLEGSINAFPTR